MSTELIAALSPWGAIVALFYLLWNHNSKCNERQQLIGEIVEAVRHLKREVGDRESGLVRSLHDFKSEVRKALHDLSGDDR